MAGTGDLRATFLAAVLASPVDDSLRLVFADWLEERGEGLDREQAELIRFAQPIRCEYRWHQDCWELGPNSWWPGLPQPLVGVALRRVAADLFSLRVGSTAVLRRGFVEEITCPWRVWRKHGPGLLQRCPLRRALPARRSPQRVVSRVLHGLLPDAPFCWRWSDQEYWGLPSGRAHALPRELFELLSGGADGRYSAPEREYPSRKAALDDLSAAVLEQARCRLHIGTCVPVAGREDET